MRRVFFPAMLSLLLWGCAGPSVVRIGHLLSTDEASLRNWNTLSALYLVVDAPGAVPENLLGKALKSVSDAGAGNLHHVEVLPGDVAAVVENELRPLSTRLLAFRKGKSMESEARWIEALNPSGVLEFQLSPLRFAIEPTERKRTRRTKDGASEEVRSLLWKKSLGVRATLRLRSLPDGRVLREKTAEIVLSDNSSRRADEKPPRGWENSLWERKKKTALQRLTRPFLAPLKTGHAARNRTIFTTKDVEEMKVARKAAQKGDWPRASGIWRSRIEKGTGGWKERHNLAVAAEAARDYSTARTLYEQSRAEGAGKDKNARTAEALQDMENSAIRSLPGETEKSRAWFGATTAVLPFSDETNSVDGPILVRETFYYALERGGYNVPHFDDIDRALRANGASQGGQLRMATKASIAAWTGTDRILLGHLSEFNEVMVGVYNKRIVKGTVTLWDRDSKTAVFESEESVKRESLHKPQAALGAFIGQLGRGLVERLAKAPLGKETRLFVERILSEIPRRPSRK